MNEIAKKLIKQNLNWDFADITIEFQEDGLTNQNYIISKDDDKYVIRISIENYYNLGINRDAELAAMKAVSTIGVGPEVVYFSTDNGNMITRFIDGKKFSNKDISTPENMSRIAQAMKKVHGLSPIPYTFSPYKDIEDRIQFAVKNNLELPHSIEKFLKKLNSIKQERDQLYQDFLGLCHNDPFTNNFLDDASIRLIDWEYAGMGDIFFDLSCICLSYTPKQKENFLKCYFGECDTGKTKSLEQMTFVVIFWNAMWAVMQTGLPGVKFDYRAMAKNMFTNMEKAL